MSLLHLRHQGAVVASLLRLASSRYRGGPLPEVPGAVVTRELPPIPEGLVTAYQNFCGGDPNEEALPSHLFPQWGFPLMVEVLKGVDLPHRRILNQGCTLTMNGRLPRRSPLYLSAQLTKLDADEYRARLTQRLATGLEAGDERLVAEIHSYIPLKRRESGGQNGRRQRTQPKGLKEVGRFQAPRGSGFRYACLTGDFNPIHWLSPAARIAGFRAPILHGFATMALTQNCIERELGKPLKRLDVRFTRPFVMPGEARIFRNDRGEIHVVDAEDQLVMAGEALLVSPSDSTTAASEEHDSHQSPEG